MSEPRAKMGGKPVFQIASKTIINFKSGFAPKLLCDGHGGCGWRGCEESATLKHFMEDDLWICPKCGGECAHTLMDEIKYPNGTPCECKSK